MSAWGKWLTEIDVPTGGWDWAITTDAGDETATVPAGTYETILELCDELEDRLNALGGVETATVTVSSVGIITIHIENAIV